MDIIVVIPRSIAMTRVAIVGWMYIAVASSACDGRNLFADEPDSLESLRKLRLVAAQDWSAVLAAKENAGDDIAPFEVMNAAKALKDAQLDVATNPRERIRALEVYRDRLQALYERVDGLFQAGTRGGEAEWRAAARYHLLDARILLKQEAAKP
jgi:hypothetical protein